MHGERRRLHLATAQVLDLQHRLATCTPGLVLIEVAERSADHHLHDACRFDLLTRQLAHITAIAQHRQTIGQRVHFGHAVADIDDGDPFVAQLAHDLEQGLGFPVGKRRGRLVHDQHAPLVNQRPSDFHLLLLGNRQLAGRCGGGKRGIQSAQHFLSATVHLADIGRSPAGTRLAAHEHVFRHGEIGGHRQFLIDQADPRRARIGRFADHRPLTVDPDLASVRLIDAGQNLHQRALAGPVLTHQRMNLMATHGQFDLIQRTRRAKALTDAFHFQNDLAHTSPLPPFIPPAGPPAAPTSGDESRPSGSTQDRPGYPTRPVACRLWLSLFPIPLPSRGSP